MATVTLQIGNSDDKLGQQEWSRFIKDIDHAVRGNNAEVHFWGPSNGDEPWQNAAWIFNCRDYDLKQIKKECTSIRERYYQESVAITTGETEFI